MDIEKYIPKYLIDNKELFQEIQILFEKAIELGLEDEFPDVTDKYKTPENMTTDAIEAFIIELGYGYLLDVFSNFPDEQKNTLIKFLFIIHYMKGTLEGLQLVLSVLGIIDYTIVEWWEDVEPEVVATGDGSTTTLAGTYSYAPFSTRAMTFTTGAIIGTDSSGSGVITGSGISSGSINFSTGAVSITFDSAPIAGVEMTVESTPHTYTLEAFIDATIYGYTDASISSSALVIFLKNYVYPVGTITDHL